MKKKLNLFLPMFMVLSLTACSSADESISGTYSINIASFDWGCGIDQVMLTLNDEVSDIDENDFTVTETKSVTDWSDETYPVIETTLDREILDAYSVDESGNKVDDSSKYVLIELRTDLNEGSPILYSMESSLNSWSVPYYLTIALSDDSTVTSNNEEVTSIQIGTEYSSVTTLVDEMKIDSFNSTDGIEMAYGTYSPETPSDTVFVWLHGSGEGGIENTDPRVSLLANKASAFMGSEFQDTMQGANVLVPQCPTFWMDADGNGGEWSNGLLTTEGPSYYTDALMELIESYKEECGADKVIVSGASAGGYMTMRLILDYPDFFDAAVPVAEALPDAIISDQELSGIVDMPLYFIYSNDDPSIIPEKFEIPTISRLEEMGATNLHVSASESVIDTSGLYTNEDGTPYTYNGHWSWIYLFNNEADCNYHGESVWEWLSDQVNY